MPDDAAIPTEDALPRCELEVFLDVAYRVFARNRLRWTGRGRAAP